MTLTPKQLAGHQRRSLRSIRERLLKMSSDWDDIDQFNVNTLEALADQVEQVATNMVDTAVEQED
ncbi:hypothetical protein WP8W19C03_10330 [Aeromonas veronii]|jgi:hypothetical protein|uniref:hypothetical protein n=1 Tax=Pseudomonadota TaxID=1224 RepID=UPI0015DC0A87|nr:MULTISPECIES: hypothetical protein [Pseudomonadota]EMD6906788.1 hypothetical protein [Citrobacter freundii]HCW3116866.1 hypothetical protein [Citrobacter amalonaticus]MCH4271775.1 hypothetical protein [Kerstersia gyiorum]MCI1227525.1 hypothetical protein [Kerstersia gyiorum]BBT94339.1 hypothetical protein WP8W19C03_10330 [Aeromonas veronii]